MAESKEVTRLRTIWHSMNKDNALELFKEAKALIGKLGRSNNTDHDKTQGFGYMEGIGMMMGALDFKPPYTKENNP